jgi:hypothetical protein
MDGDQVAKILDSIAKLVAALVWPAAIAFMIVRFRSNIADFIDGLGELTLKGAGFEASFRRKQDAAEEALIAATVSKSTEGAASLIAVDARRSAMKVVGRVKSRAIRRVNRSIVMWVDDRPENNDHERQALASFGIRFVMSTSTEDAVLKAKTVPLDAIISDMGRPPDPRQATPCSRSFAHVE